MPHTFSHQGRNTRLIEIIDWTEYLVARNRKEKEIIQRMARNRGDQRTGLNHPPGKNNSEDKGHREIAMGS